MRAAWGGLGRGHGHRQTVRQVRKRSRSGLAISGETRLRRHPDDPTCGVDRSARAPEREGRAGERTEKPDAANRHPQETGGLTGRALSYGRPGLTSGAPSDSWRGPGVAASGLGGDCVGFTGRTASWARPGGFDARWTGRRPVKSRPNALALPSRPSQDRQVSMPPPFGQSHGWSRLACTDVLHRVTRPLAAIESGPAGAFRTAARLACRWNTSKAALACSSAQWNLTGPVW